MNNFKNYETTKAGKVRAVCRFCGKKSKAHEATSKGEPDLFELGKGWSQACYPKDHQHKDGSTGSLFSCPNCNKLLMARNVLVTRNQNKEGDTKMNTTAQKLKAECKSAADVMERAEQMRANADQNWDKEKTTYTFEDGSKLEVSGPLFDVVE